MISGRVSETPGSLKIFEAEAGIVSPELLLILGENAWARLGDKLRARVNAALRIIQLAI